MVASPKNPPIRSGHYPSRLPRLFALLPQEPVATPDDSHSSGVTRPCQAPLACTLTRTTFHWANVNTHAHYNHDRSRTATTTTYYRVICYLSSGSFTRRIGRPTRLTKQPACTVAHLTPTPSRQRLVLTVRIVGSLKQLVNPLRTPPLSGLRPASSADETHSTTANRTGQHCPSEQCHPSIAIG